METSQFPSGKTSVIDSAGLGATSKRREGILGGLDKVVNVGVGVGGGKEVDLELGRLEINAGA